MISGDTNDHDAMLIHPEMFSGTRAHPTYSFGQYPYHNPQYNEMQANIVPDVTYHQQNIVSWPYSSNTKPYDDWIQQQQQQQQPQNMSTTATALPNQNYGSSCLPTSYHHHHLQRNQNDVQCSSNGLMMPQDLVSSGSGPDGQTSPNSVVAVSSDGLSGSESPGCSVHPQGPLNRPQAARSPYEWMKKTSYQTQPNPGKTRTRDKYRMVYTDHQRLELEKEFHASQFITMNRKTELAKVLGLSERQIKIWFQNRRAKGRKQALKQHDIIQNNIRIMQTNHYSPFHFQAISNL